LNAAPNTIYRRAILQAIESLKDFQSRSSIDAVRRHTQDILEDHTWNDALFLVTFKSIVKSGDIDLYPHVSAELSPGYKRNRTDSLLRRLDESMKDAPPMPTIPLEPTHRIITGVPLKEPPKRRAEHDKWKILPKTVYDKTRLE